MKTKHGFIVGCKQRANYAIFQKNKKWEQMKMTDSGWMFYGHREKEPIGPTNRFQPMSAAFIRHIITLIL